MAKRKKSSKVNKSIKVDKSSKILGYVAWTLSIVAGIIISLTIGYYFGISDATKAFHSKKEKQKITQMKKSPRKELTVKKRLEEVLHKGGVKYTTAAHEIDDESLANPPKIKNKKLIIYNHKPKLAIIIDDVQTASQVKAIKSLHIPLTMSFLPPRPGRPNSAKLASHEKFYMVHLPMEAMHFSSPEPDTLKVNDSQKKISQRIAEIKKEFPRVQYINNHTGSKFTSNEVAMNRLIFALKANNINFIDSRTTAKTMAPKVLKNFGLKYVARDVFLDHHMEKAYVLKQIKEAIKVAKAHGHAIAIGHPHKNTLAALAESKDLFKDVDLVQINKIY
ncbi:divergent polysaccharide deacetylase family protein [Sulfurimonas sp.]